MTAIAALLEHPYAQALAWALIHFLWQGAAVGLAVWLVFRYTRLGASGRYTIGVAALAVMLAAPIVTFAFMLRQSSPAATPTGAPLTLSVAPVTTDQPAPKEQKVRPAPHPSALDGPFEPFVLAVWLTGVLVLSVRLFGGWMLTRRFATRGLVPVAAEIDAAGRRIADGLGLTRLVRLFESASVNVPVTIGWMRPVVLFPMSAISGLSSAQVEALLAHELAHIRRHDYLVNLLQSAVETLLFYHPAVWWISKQVRAEREHCCDDLVVALCDRVVYVRALTDLATLATTPRMALAATDGSLMRRVRRLLGEPGVDREVGTGWLSGLFAVLLVGGVVPVAVTSMAAPDSKPNAVVEPPPQGVQGGVQGGVQSGVAGGVQEGVAGGVPGGVVVAVPEPRFLHVDLPRFQGTASEQSAEQAAALARLIEAQQRMREQQTAIDLQQIEIEMKRAQASLDAKRAATEAKVEELHAALQRAQAQFQKAIVSAEVPAAVEAQLRAAMADLELVRREREFTSESMQLKRMALERAREMERITSDIERAHQDGTVRAERQGVATSGLELQQMAEDYERLRRLYARLLSEAEKARLAGKDDQALTQKLEEARRDLMDRELKLEATRRLLQTQVQSLDRAALSQALEAQARLERLNQVARPIEENSALDRGTELARDDRARAGDYVVLEIGGEPNLQRNFVVSKEGSIKLPFINAIKVEGLTTSQIRDAISREVGKYTANPKVSVTVRRPRGQ